MDIDYRDGKIHGWNGGDCPVHKNDKIFVWLSGGDTIVGIAETFEWGHESIDSQPRSWNIIAFRVVEKYEEPVTIYVNWYEDEEMYGSLYHTKEAAQGVAKSCGSRFKTMKFVSVAD